MLKQSKSPCGSFEFISYLATPQEKFFVGILTILLYGKIRIAFKVVPTKDGKGNFITAPSYPISENGQKRYIQAVLVDSRGEDSALQDFMRICLKEQASSSVVPSSIKQNDSNFYENVDVGTCPF